ncbi:MAG: copper-binding protein [Pseudolabrys sp.]|nr:copper-binding protein [Pseudolabrys sp.]
MNIRTLVTFGALALATLGSFPVIAQTDEFIAGQVTKVDESAGKITIKHGPLKKFDMDEGMTMVFHAADPAMTKTVKAGDKVRFVPDRINGQFTVTKIEKAK